MVGRDVLTRIDPMEKMQIRYFWCRRMQLLDESLVMQFELHHY